jgi:hypothetical protein
MNKQRKSSEAVIQDCYRNLPPKEQHCFAEIIEFIRHHPGSARLLSEATTKGFEDPSEVFEYMIDNWVGDWVDSEPLN